MEASTPMEAGGSRLLWLPWSLGELPWKSIQPTSMEVAHARAASMEVECFTSVEAFFVAQLIWKCITRVEREVTLGDNV